MNPSESLLAASVSRAVAKYADPAATMASILFAGRDPQGIAYTCIAPDLSARPLTWGELQAESAALGRGFEALGIRPGERVATLMRKSRDYLVTLFAIWRIGAVHVPLFTAFATDPIDYRLRASGSRLVICDPAQVHKLKPLIASRAEELIVVSSGDAGPGELSLTGLRSEAADAPPSTGRAGGSIIEIYTSGTTGPAKGVTVGLRALAAFQIYLETGLGITADDVFWNAADPGWAYGLYFGVLAPCLTGAPALLFDGAFNAGTTLEILQRFKVTNFAAAPTVYRALEAARLPLHGPLALNKASSAGEPLTPEINEWAARYLGIAVHDHYGQTETGMIVNNHHHPLLQAPLKPGSMGQAMPGWRIAILQADREAPALPGDIGRVAVDVRASPLAWFDGYRGDSAKATEKYSADGRWYLTGDVGRMDEDGYVYFSSRDDDVIIMSGYRISPLDIESVLLRHPAIAECAVVAVTDKLSGERVEAVVVLRDALEPSEALTRELQMLVKNGFAAHAYPRRIHFVAALPKTASGKVKRSDVRRTLKDSMAHGLGAAAR